MQSTACEAEGPTGQLTDRGSVNLSGLELGRGHRQRKVPSHLQDYWCYYTQKTDPLSLGLIQKVSWGNPYPKANYVTSNNFSYAYRACLTSITKVMEPRYFHEVVKDPHWKELMAKEIEAPTLNRTWTLEDFPSRKKLICKWVDKVKYDSNGTIECYKTLVIRGINRL